MSERAMEAALERSLEKIDDLGKSVEGLRDRVGELERRLAEVEKREEMLEFPDAAGDAPV